MPKTSVAEEETALMFPELDDSDPKHKELLKAARRFHKSKQERDELLSTAKEKVDGDEARLIAMCHTLGLEKFRHNGYRVEISTGKEKARVKVEADEEEEGEEE